MDFLIALFLLIGSFFTLVGSVGLVKLPDFFMRLHGPTKATTLGVGAMLVASMLYYFSYHDIVRLNELLIIIFLFMTAPVSAHLMSKAALHKKKADEKK
ncbi:MAG TPA: Na+/H+ antiporter subunit G [Sulfurovum sp.]|nr:Na+/H+ antiporter subunit G [Sulfurovum sp.]